MPQGLEWRERDLGESMVGCCLREQQFHALFWGAEGAHPKLVGSHRDSAMTMTEELEEQPQLGIHLPPELLEEDQVPSRGRGQLLGGPGCLLGGTAAGCSWRDGPGAGRASGQPPKAGCPESYSAARSALQRAR